MPQILGIDTSNYTTSLALLELGSGEIVQARQLLPVKAGAVGLRQSDAVFHHTRQIPALFEQLSQQFQSDPLCGIAVSTRPRDVDGSYMPCFLVGQTLARSIAAVNGLPVYTTSHQMGHVLAALYAADRLDARHAPFLAFHVSGGTTDLLYCTPDPAGVLRITPCGTSLDLKAGQAVDRVGLMLGLQFPCGPTLEQLAQQSTREFRLRPVIRRTDCCLSGLENQCKRMLEQQEPAADIAKYCLMTIAATLAEMVAAARAQYGQVPVLFAGGVMANRLIRPYLLERMDGWFTKPEFSSDNAAGVVVYGALMQGGAGPWLS